MPNETIVQYILNVDTGKAEKGLKDTSRASKQTEQSFDQVGQATTKMNAKLKSTEQQSKRTSRAMRNVRKAGRDLDGAFGDLAQGANLISPALGNMFMTMSDGASVMDGLARIGVGAFNPMLLGVVAAASAAALAFDMYTRSQEQLKNTTEFLVKMQDTLSESIKNQEKAVQDADASLVSYTDKLINLQQTMAIEAGELTSFDVQRKMADQKALKDIDELNEKQQKAIELTRRRIKNAKALFDEEKKLLSLDEESFRALERGMSQDSLEIKLMNDRMAITKAEGELSTQLQKVERGKARIKEIRDLTLEQIDLNEKKKEEGEIERKNAKNRAQSERERKQQQAAAQKLQGIINKLTLGELTGREKIEEQYKQELAQINKLAEKSGDIENAEKARLLILQKRDRLLDEELRKEQEKLAIQKLQAKEVLSIISSTVQALRSPEAFVSGLGGIAGQVGQAGGFAGLTAAAPTISAAGSAVTAIAGFGSLIQKAIDESDVSLDENQARRVVLGNMNEAFQNFNRDLERGLELLPETLVRVLPAFVVSLAKVLTVDLARVIAVDLPVALIRSIPEVTIAVINEVAFLLVDLVNGFKLALDQFTSFIQSVFTREGRRDAVASSIDGLKRFFETRFDGVGALRESVSAFAGGGSFIPQAAGGMRFTGNQRSGLAMLHQGEFVVPQSGMRPQSVDRQMNRSGGSPINIVINSPVVEQNAVDALVRRIEERFNSNFGLASSNLFGGR